MKIADASAGVFKCVGMYSDVYCPTEESFPSPDAVTIAVIAAAPITEPLGTIHSQIHTKMLLNCVLKYNII